MRRPIVVVYAGLFTLVHARGSVRSGRRRTRQMIQGGTALFATESRLRETLGTCYIGITCFPSDEVIAASPTTRLGNILGKKNCRTSLLR